MYVRVRVCMCVYVAASVPPSRRYCQDFDKTVRNRNGYELDKLGSSVLE